MKTVRVNASRSYDVLIGRGLLGQTGACLKELFSGGELPSVVLVTDDTVGSLYARECLDSLGAAGFSAECFTFPHGEASKNLGTLSALLEFLARRPLTRTDVLVALGGGVTGDLCGFAASVYLRGIRYVQIPTTLLAAVDSSVGGKTAVDLDAGKNLAGSFWQPSLVLCDPDLLGTLPPETFADGCAEVIKYGMLSDLALLETLERFGPEFPREEVIAACVADKRDVVEADEKDTGVRRLLNFGHTAGHAVELCSRYTVPHGRAVAMGMSLVTRAAAKEGVCDPALAARLDTLLCRFGLPTADDCAYPASDLADAAAADKKRTGGSISLILPTAPGKCEVCPRPAAELEAFFAKGL